MNNDRPNYRSRLCVMRHTNVPRLCARAHSPYANTEWGEKYARTRAHTCPFNCVRVLYHLYIGRGEGEGEGRKVEREEKEFGVDIH